MPPQELEAYMWESPVKGYIMYITPLHAKLFIIW